MNDDLLGPAAWAVMAFGRVQKLVVRPDVADELACKWHESDPEATAAPLYTWATVEAEMRRAVAAERERWAAKAGEYAQAWWSKHCASNKHMETTRAAHEDFCRLQADIRKA